MSKAPIRGRNTIWVRLWCTRDAERNELYGRRQPKAVRIELQNNRTEPLFSSSSPTSTHQQSPRLEKTRPEALVGAGGRVGKEGKSGGSDNDGVVRGRPVLPSCTRTVTVQTTRGTFRVLLYLLSLFHIYASQQYYKANVVASVKKRGTGA